MANNIEETLLHYISNYSDKSVAVIGSIDKEATRPYKAQLARLGGKFNMRLKDDRSDERVPGWIFSSKTAEDNDLLKFIDDVNSGEIEGDSSGEDQSKKKFEKKEVSSNKIPIKKSIKSSAPSASPIDVKVTPEDFEAIRRKKKNSIIIHLDASSSLGITPGYWFNLVEHDESEPDDNLVRLKKTAIMVIISNNYRIMDDMIDFGDIVRSVNLPKENEDHEGNWVVLRF